MNYHWPDRDYWIVGREHLLYDCISLADIPANHQTKVLDQKIRRMSPFNDTGRYVFRQGEYAMVWVWDESRRRAAVEDLKTRYASMASHFEKLSPLPETVLYPRAAEGEVQQACCSGADMQRWQDSVMRSSRWVWVANPVTLPEPANEPWTESRKLSVDGAEQIVWRGGLLILFLIVLFQLGAYAGWHMEKNTMADRVDASRANMALLMEERRKVRLIQNDNQQLNEWLAVPSQISILADFDELMPTSVEITAWDYEDGGLKITIIDENLDNRAYVERMASGARFDNVRVEPGADTGTAVVSLSVVAQ